MATGIISGLILALLAGWVLKPPKASSPEESAKSWQRTGMIVLALFIGCTVFVMMLKS